jgi:hypothetical protein
MDFDDISLIQDREHCWALVDTIMKLRFPNIGRFHPFYRPRRPSERVEVQLYSVFRPRH